MTNRRRNIRRMSLGGAFIAAVAAAAVLLLAACGGGDSSETASSGGSTASSTPPPLTPLPSSTSISTSNAGKIALFSPTVAAPIPGSVAGSWSTRRCSPVPLTTTFLGGALFVAEQGTVGLSLLSDGGSSASGTAIFGSDGFSFMYDAVFGIPNVSNPQDRWGIAATFPPGTPVGTSIQVQFRTPRELGLIHDEQTVPSAYPRGIPIQLWQRKERGTGWSEANSSSTAGLGKDIPTPAFPTASVTYGPNNTATVTFFATTDDPSFTVGLTNVCGPGLRNPVLLNGVRDLAFDPASGQIRAFRGAPGSGIYIDPMTGRLGATFSGVAEPNGSTNTTTAPDAEGRTFTLTPTATPSVWTLSSSTGTSITLTDIVRAGGSDTVVYGSVIRYGTRGVAFRIVLDWAGDYVYLVDSPALIP